MTPEQWQKIDHLLEMTLDLPAGERAIFLEQACAGDAGLRAEIETLLRAHDQATGFIERPPATEMAEVFDMGGREDLSGQRIGPYQLISELGRGGMGVVYLAARADDEFRKQVAIKLVGYGPQNAPVMRRFRRERQILASLDHPNIARLLDGGRTEQGWPYLVMEYVEGTPINAYCHGHRLSITARLKLFRDVCRAVQYAHQNLVIHRDLKPSNILVTEDGAVKLLDFGIAKLLHTESGAITQTFTTQLATGALMMTPEYASPEQVRGALVTTASDVYSLGVVLYELLAGGQPYVFKDRSLPEMVRVICEEEPEPPSAAIMQNAQLPQQFSEARLKLRAQLRGDPDQIVMTALQKDVQLRYRSVEQLGEDLRRHLEGKPILARQASWRYRMGKFVRRYKAGVALSALLLLTLLGGIVGTAWQARVAGQYAETNRRLAYAGQMHLAAQAWEMANVRQLRELLDNQLPKAGEADLRGFEWYHLWRLTYQNGERLTLPHTTEVWSVAVSPDGKQIATAHSEDDSTVRLWDAATGNLLSVLKGSGTQPWMVAFSPDGRRLATVHHDDKDTVSLFDLAAGGTPRILPGHTRPTRVLAFSSDGQKLFTGSDDKTVKVWDTGTGKELLTIENCAEVRGLAVSPDGRLLATQCSSELVLWDARTGSRLRSLKNPMDAGLWSILFSTDGRTLIIGGKFGEARLLDVMTGQEVRTFASHNGGIRGMAISGDGKLLATASEDRTAKVWEVDTGRELAALKGHLAELYGVAFAPDGKTLVTASTDFTAKIWELESVSDRSVLATGTIAEALSPDGNRIAVRGPAGRLRLLDAVTGREQAVLPNSEGKGGGQTRTVVFSPDSKLLAACNRRDNKVWLWDCATGRELPPFATTHSVRSLAFSPDGKKLLTGGDDHAARLWGLASGQEIRAFKNHEHVVWVVAFSPDGRKLATGSVDKTVRLWEVETGRELASVKGQQKPILSLAFSPDGKMLAVGSADSTVKLLDLTTGRELHTLTGLAGHVQGLAFSPDGQRLATGSGDGVIRLWNPFLGQQLIMLRGHMDLVSMVAFTPDGRTLISGSNDTNVRRWVTATAQEATARGRQSAAGN